MSPTVTAPIQILPDRGEPSSSVVERQAFYLTSQGHPLFAWLHTRQAGSNVDHGVVICPPIGHEQLHAHRTLRHLADALARQGTPTLRFDWHGTGDSAGQDEDPSRLATWQANVRDTVEWMRQELGCRHVSVIGMRLGATLAALASEDHDIDNLVLWAPVTNGRAYVREMKAIDLTSEYRPVTRPEDSSDIEAAGYVLSQLAAAELSLVNLLKSSPRCRHGLIVMRDDLPADLRLRDRCAELGFPVDQIAVPGFNEMLAEPHRTHIPTRAIQEISTWLQQQIETEATHELTRLPKLTTDIRQPATSIRNRILEISSNPHLFGIISEPVTGPMDNLPTIVLLNSGSTHHVGPGRLHVHIARRLAANGFRCLRLDINGLGDSITTDLANENETYPSTAFRDVQLALHRLQTEYGMRQCVLMGLCSGAYAAFQSAACIPDACVVESILINPLTYFWKDGMTVDTAPVRQLIVQHHYLESVLQPQKWFKLLSGRTKIGLLGALKILAQRLPLIGSSNRSGRHVSSEDAPPRTLSHPVQDDTPGDLTSIAAAGRTLAMFFTDTDPGYSILLHKAKRQTKQLCSAGQLRVTFIKDADHTFSRRASRQELIESLLEHLQNRFPIA
jgi:alpha-beta hydrolase superfamily lysophospholipase